jgi:hypothetical protein
MRYQSFTRIAIIIFSLLFTCSQLLAQTKEENLTIESYYKIKWSYANEFIALWKKNHYPLNKKAQEKGDIISITAEKPILHSGEDTRWDFKVTIVYKNAAAGLDHGITDQFKKQLYPDLEKLAKDEQHRFDLVLAHWDVITEKIDLSN